jgi:hypothetical protein
MSEGSPRRCKSCEHAKVASEAYGYFICHKQHALVPLTGSCNIGLEMEEREV